MGEKVEEKNYKNIGGGRGDQWCESFSCGAFRGYLISAYGRGLKRKNNREVF